ncbi:MAG: YggS family pyridoxal phosphate enzyme [Acidimicrobiia bacterium]|nr:MAG: YggS family pyridoxal phosphate enzyme [Acidimicrobiia bacterium]
MTARDAGRPPVDVAASLAAVRARVDRAARAAGRDPAEVTLVAVVKNVDPARIGEAIRAGQRDFGENRAQELVAHAAAVGTAATHAGVRWHFVGRLQSNKVRAVAPLVARWHSIDRVELVALLARHAPHVPALVQVNVAGEPSKGGCTPAGAPALVDALRGAGVTVDGLMTVPPAAEDPAPHFDALRALAERLGLRELSMGMTGDFEVAIAYGATFVRVGAAVFGARPHPTDLRR